MKTHKYHFKFKYDDEKSVSWTGRTMIEAETFNPASMSDLLKVQDSIKKDRPLAFNIREVRRVG